jgi:hypothetical protein
MEFYRYEMRRYARLSAFDEVSGHDVSLDLITLNLHKETPQGYWIGYGNLIEGQLRSESKWVSKTSRKRYAYPTKEEAKNNFIARTEKRIRILNSQLTDSKQVLNLIKTL